MGTIQYESDAWDQTERDDADGEQDIEPSDVGEREEERFEVEELEILGHQCQEWRQAGKKKKPAVLLSIWEEMQRLDRNKELRGSKVQMKCKAVVHKLYQEQIQEKLAKMKVEEGNTHGSKQIQQYQNALMAFIQDDLTEEQLAAAEDIAERWNGWEGPMPETKECSQVWVQVCLKLCDGDVEVLQNVHNGIPFNDVCTLEGSWQEYLGETFEEPGTPPKHDGESSPEHAQKKTVAKATRTGKVDSVKLVKNANGEIWIGEIAGLSQDQLQKMVRRFVTAHYCEWPEIYLQLQPKSHVDDNSYPATVLLVQKWINQSGKLQPPVDRTLAPLQVVRQWKYQKTPAPKCKKNPRRKNVKGKGKVQEEGVAYDSVDDSMDNSTDDSLDDHSKAEVSNVGTDGPSAKKVSGRRQNCAKTPFPSHSHSNPPPADGSHSEWLSAPPAHAKTPVHRPQNKVLTDYNGQESNGHASDDEADEDTYLPTLSNSKKTATSLNTNPDLHSGNEYTTELQDHSEYTDEDGLESIPFTDHPTEEGSTSRKNGGKLKSALKRTHQASLALSESSEPDVNRHQPGAKYLSKSKHNGSVTTNAASANVKQGIPGGTWKSPCVRKAPARPDADVPSPDAKRSHKQTGSNQKWK
ncbi:hypothetical protein F5J12DRAFT_783528 [Pisolithus orientalis]|uniref:uncharacterized protein n=1 Tax=Pisolithus orientalis TaxID=936130 RepID=UPI002223F791|nr:uncharacterized protein F5J12DRAFT_783528 [Pisolithus orientalis]KAI6003457.1 hypothetical protein F5J12DRAFT_783528 [Pisolithus orientalis]